MRIIFLKPKQLLAFALTTILFQNTIFGQSGPCASCSDGGNPSLSVLNVYNLRMLGNFQMATNPTTGNFPFRINDKAIDGGRFFVGDDNSSGNVAIGNPNNTGVYPVPLAKLHVNGTGIMGNTLISSDLSVAKKWIALPANSTSLWGLWVDKGVVATDYAITTTNNWADFVFEPNYRLRPLHEVESFIKANKHLPEIPSADELKKDGYTLQNMNARFMQKIEELTLYAIEKEKQVTTLQQKLNDLEKRIETLEKR